MEHGAWSIKHGAWSMEYKTWGTEGRMARFRFQDLKIWQLAIEIADELFDIADELERKKLYRFADQLRGAGMSMSNNISEGAGSDSKKEFARFLIIARRSTFENAKFSFFYEDEHIYLKKKLSNY
jgi:four helix bundle protein